MTQDSTEAKGDSRVESTSPFVEHHVPQEQGNVYARDYKGAGPTFVLMHGFPDNLHIWPSGLHPRMDQERARQQLAPVLAGTVI
jgi:hypothetical protein